MSFSDRKVSAPAVMPDEGPFLDIDILSIPLACIVHTFQQRLCAMTERWHLAKYCPRCLSAP